MRMPPRVSARPCARYGDAAPDVRRSGRPGGRIPAQTEASMKGRIPALLLTTALAACGGPEAAPPPPPVPVFGAQSGYARVSDEIVDWYLSRHPTLAVRVGDHSYDTTIGSYFAGDLEQARRDARSLLTRLDAVNRSALPRDDYFDHRLIENGLRAELLDLEGIGGWQRDPMRYLALALPPAAGTALPPEAMAARWRQLPLVLRAARLNLDPARVAPASIDGARDVAAVLRQYAAQQGGGAERAAVASIDSFTVWLDQLETRATGGALGADNLARLLRYSSHVEIPLDQLDAINRQAIAEHREWLERIGLGVDPLSHAEDILASLMEQDQSVRDLAGQVLPQPDGGLSPIRALFVPARFSLGVSHYAAVADVEQEAVDDVEQLIGIRRALHGHALLHGMLQLHANGASLENVARDIAAIALIEPDDAIMWATALLYDPELGLLALDRMQLFALRDRMRARSGAFSEQAFRARVLELGLPIPLAAEAMLGDDLEPLLVVGRRTPGVPEPPSIGD
jgi:hypothetical protein